MGGGSKAAVSLSMEGRHRGSIGCIDLTSEIGDFADLVEPFGGKKIKLTVTYAKVNQRARDDPAHR
jgi:hypothetical protein